MKPILEHLPVREGESFFVGQFAYPYFPTPFHYHPEYELVLVNESRGQRVVDCHIDSFGKGDLTLLGPNLPHLYRNDPDYYQGESTLRAESIVVHFSESSLGRDFLALPQLSLVRQLLIQSAQGLDILGKTREAVTQKLGRLLTLSGIARLLVFVETLELIAESGEYRMITQPLLTKPPVESTERLHLIIDYLTKQFNQPIALTDVAQVAGLTRTSLCRYFRERTKRSLGDFLNELRLRHAARQLRETQRSVLDISLDSGFENLSNFNRAFRQFYKVTPSLYRKQLLNA